MLSVALVEPVDDVEAAAKARVLARLEEYRASQSPEAYKTLVAELVSAGKQQGGREEVFWCSFEDEYCPPTDWLESWSQGAIERPAEAARWLRSRPDVVKQLALRFPPSCIVRGTVPMRCPSPGNVGIVSSYVEPKEGLPDGALGVLAHPNGRILYHCAPGSLAVVGYFKGLTPEVLSHFMARQTQ